VSGQGKQRVGRTYRLVGPKTSIVYHPTQDGACLSRPCHRCAGRGRRPAGPDPPRPPESGKPTIPAARQHLRFFFPPQNRCSSSTLADSRPARPSGVRSGCPQKKMPLGIYQRGFIRQRHRERSTCPQHRRLLTWFSLSFFLQHHLILDSLALVQGFSRTCQFILCLSTHPPPPPCSPPTLAGHSTNLLDCYLPSPNSFALPQRPSQLRPRPASHECYRRYTCDSERVPAG
jgi:hypothetical protein